MHGSLGDELQLIVMLDKCLILDPTVLKLAQERIVVFDCSSHRLFRRIGLLLEGGVLLDVVEAVFTTVRYGPGTWETVLLGPGASAAGVRGGCCGSRHFGYFSE